MDGVGPWGYEVVAAGVAELVGPANPRPVLGSQGAGEFLGHAARSSLDSRSWCC